MNPNVKRLPTILAIGGHDPTGGAGIQADIETGMANRVGVTTLITALTAQSTAQVHAVLPVDTELLALQLREILEEFPPHAIKIGLTADEGVIEVLADGLKEQCVPIVIDPVLAAGSGDELSSSDMAAAIASKLLPLASLVTPNHAEALRLAKSGGDTLDAAQKLSAQYDCHVLLTGTDCSEHKQVQHVLLNTSGPLESWQWPRLAGSYHGSGCTLATAIAAGLAHQETMQQACLRGQAYTYHSLRNAWQKGYSQWIPYRRDTEQN